ncbi:glycosyltransferase [Photorhabdus temperata]|uniref:glycosyltransferase n=1 Tax=Photorhabdus temperata TaxID=574560 RepID=UPI0021D4BA68|nr:glycosyltransferase [Photorhabdus temperata]MCT8346724.1 glycosyltransferase [Photorhabdus temperata]
MTKKKITIVLPNLNAGGAEQVVLVLSKWLAFYGHDVKLVLFNKTGQFLTRLPNGLEPITPKFNLGKIFNLIQSFGIIIKCARKSDVILAGLELSPTYICYLIGALTNKPVIGWLHIDLCEYFKRLRFIHKYIMKFIYPRLDAVVAVSEGVKETAIREVLGGNCASIVRIYNINYNLRSYTEQSCHINEIITNKKYILAVGRLTEQKGFDLIIKAHSKLVEYNPDLHLLILGEGPERTKLEQLVKELKISNYVHMPGFVDNVTKYYEHCWLFVHPARFEGLGMVLIEAMAKGKPVIATNCPSGPNEILCGGEFGVLIPPNNIDLIIQSIIKFESDAYYEHYSMLSTKRAKDFSYIKIIPEWEILLNKLIRI